MAEPVGLLGDLPAGWRWARLGDLASKIGSGATPRGGEAVYVDAGTTFIRSQNVLDHGMDVTDIARIDEDAAAALAGVTVEPGDVLLNITGDSILRCAIVGDDLLPARVNQHVAIIRVAGRLEPLILQSYLTLPGVKAWLLGIAAAGGTRKAITKADIERIPVPVPPLPDQRAIAQLLGAIQARLASNARVVRLVEQIAQHAIGRVQADAPRSVPLSEIVKPVAETVAPTELAPGTPYVGLEHLPRGRLILDRWADASAVTSAKANFRAGDVLFGRLRPYFRKVALAPVDGICSTDVLVLRPHDDGERVLALATCSSPSFIDYATSGSNGTRMPRATWDHLARFLVPVPAAEVLSRLQAVIEPLLACGQHRVTESATLASLRDTLVPELLSGRLRVPAAA